jgi:hypothetical protein
LLRRWVSSKELSIRSKDQSVASESLGKDNLQSTLVDEMLSYLTNIDKLPEMFIMKAFVSAGNSISN